MGNTHLWFVTLHPFEDGNSRISRALTDMSLAIAENEKNRFYSMSTQIRKQRKSYYNILERTQKGTLDISEWLIWFLNCLYQSIIQPESLLANVLNKAKFWEEHACKTLNEGQITLMLITAAIPNKTEQANTNSIANSIECAYHLATLAQIQPNGENERVDTTLAQNSSRLSRTA